MNPSHWEKQETLRKQERRQEKEDRGENKCSKSAQMTKSVSCAVNKLCVFEISESLPPGLLNFQRFRDQSRTRWSCFRRQSGDEWVCQLVWRSTRGRFTVFDMVPQLGCIHAADKLYFNTRVLRRSVRIQLHKAAVFL